MQNDKNPKRIQNYSVESKSNIRKDKYIDAEDIKINIEEEKNDTRKNFNNTIRERSQESSKNDESEDFNERSDLSSSSSSDKEGLSSKRREESDINDRVDWKMSDENRPLEKASYNNQNLKMSKENGNSSERKTENDVTKMEKNPPSDLDEISEV